MKKGNSRNSQNFDDDKKDQEEKQEQTPTKEDKKKKAENLQSPNNRGSSQHLSGEQQGSLHQATESGEPAILNASIREDGSHNLGTQSPSSLEMNFAKR